LGLELIKLASDISKFLGDASRRAPYEAGIVVPIFAVDWVIYWVITSNELAGVIEWFLIGLSLLGLLISIGILVTSRMVLTDFSGATGLRRLKGKGTLAWVATAGVLGMAVVIFAGLTTFLHQGSRLELIAAKPGTEVAYLSVMGFYYWNLADMIPLLRVPETLRWEAKYDYTDISVGWMVLAFKIIIAIPILKVLSIIFQRLFSTR